PGQGRHQGLGMVVHTTPPRGERIGMLWRDPGTDHSFSASAAELVMVRPPTVSSLRAGCLTACGSLCHVLSAASPSHRLPCAVTAQHAGPFTGLGPPVLA